MFKKLLPIFLVLILAIGLVACGEKKEETTVLKGELTPNVQSTVTLYHKGEKLTKMVQVHNIEYKYTKFLDASDAKEQIEPNIQELNKVEGYNEKVDYKKDLMVSTVEMDFTKLSTEDMRKIPGLNIEGDPKEGLNYEKTLENYKNQGLKEQ